MRDGRTNKDMTMTEDQYNSFLQRYRSMGTKELHELRKSDLTEIATNAIDKVIAERVVSADQQQEITEPVAEERRTMIKPYGVGGLLALLVIGMIIIGPIWGAESIYSTITMIERHNPRIVSLPQWTTYKSVTWGSFLVVIALNFYGGVGLVCGRNRSVVTRAKMILWITGPLASIIYVVIIPFIVFGKTPVIDSKIIGGVIFSFIFAGFWTIYLSVSRRVRNTYGGSHRS